jgi:hypothetical protein
MNKYVLSFIFAAHLFLFGDATATDHFAKMKPRITENAQNWIGGASALTSDVQLAYLNFFALNLELLQNPSDELVRVFFKCAEYIGKEEKVIALHQQFAEFLETIIKEYDENIRRKIALKGNISKEEETSIGKQLEEKLQELVAYITTIYYQMFYTNAAKTNKKLVYMFDENGIIPQGKRTKALPSTL